MHGTSHQSGTEANTRVIETNLECLSLTLERLFHPQVICSDSGGDCSRLDDIIRFFAQSHEQEERLMIKTDYPDFAAHKRKHKALVRTLNGMKHILVCGNYDNSLVSGFLAEWTKRHSKGFDIPFGEFIKKHEIETLQKKGH